MSTRTKRTYNLSIGTVRRVREMAEQYGVAPTQDAVVALAVDELERRLREEREASVWEEAATDPALTELADAYRNADRETWPA